MNRSRRSLISFGWTTIFPVVAFCAVLPGHGWAEDFQGASHKLEFDEPPIQYSDQTPADAVARLQHRISTGEATLRYDEQFGYLPALLRELKVSPRSQGLVFSKTSLQRTFITPKNPRAVYFNDDVYIGYVPGAPALEVATVDPKLGGIFYRLENEEVKRPRFVRTADCLSCHGAERTLGVPGFLVRSIGTDSTGELAPETEMADVDQCTPLDARWAGWYVTGQVGKQTHRGNLVGQGALENAARGGNPLLNLSSLATLFDVKKELRPTSDIVSLMVLEHQAKMHNYLTRLSYETRHMMTTYGHIRYLKHQEDAFLRYLLFTEEAPLTSPISGDPQYAQEFTAQGPADAKGRSLREFDLHTHLFKYPCSFLIYSPQFDALPPVMHDRLLGRLHAILTGEDKDPQFASLGPEQRQAILEILRETKPNLPASWR